MSRETWLAERRGGIGGSDAAAILGVSKFSTAYDCWLDKTRELAPKEANEAMWWGSELEDLVARRYMIETGRKVWNPERIYYHEKWPVLRGTPDRLCIGAERGLEIKTTSAFNVAAFGEPGTDQIPEAYLLQVAVYMAITGFPAWDVAVLVGGNDFRIYTVRRDLEFEKWMVGELRVWWERYVEGNVPPPITGADSVADSLARAYPREQFTMIEPTPEIAGLATMLDAARQNIARGEAVRAECENKLKAILGDAEGVTGEDFKVTWRATKESEKVDWPALARRAMDALERAKISTTEMLAEHTIRKPGTRRFVFTPLVMGETVAAVMKRFAGKKER